MRSRKTVLEQNVIDAARTFVNHPYGFTHFAVDLAKAVAELDAFLAPLEDTQGAFAPGSTTSEQASLAPLRHGSVRRRIVDEIRTMGLRQFALGLTDDELEQRLNRAHTTVSSARNWLCQAGWLQATDRVRKTRSGFDATVWELTPAATAWVSSPEWVERSKP